MGMTPLEKSILSTISYFDIFDFPLTFMEIWKWLWFDREPQVFRLDEIRESLEKSGYLQKRLGAQGGFYFLRGREEIIQTRLERYSLAELKYHKAKQMIRWLRWLPFVRMIGVCNTLAFNNSRQDADIDLFIITKRRRVWQTRFWVTGWLKVLGLRPRPDRTRDRLCASFFVDEDHLDLHELAIADDIYLPYWITQVVPVYDEGVYDRFIAANQWVRKLIPNSIPVMPTKRRQVRRLGWSKKVINRKFSLWPEIIFRKYQLAIMPDNLKSKIGFGSQVVVQDGILKFHDNDRRALFLKRWRERMSKYQ